jgi:hypothetical protein
MSCKPAVKRSFPLFPYPLGYDWHAMSPRKPTHHLSEIDCNKMRAVCSICGPTDIRVRHDRGKYSYYYCNTRMRERTATYRRAKGIPLPSPSHHRLSEVDLENRTAVCSKCGRVKIYVVKQGNKYKSRCSNTLRKQVVKWSSS